MNYDDTDRDDVTTYGEDLIKDARRWARQELGGELDRLKSQVAQQAVQANHQRCMTALDADPELRDKWRTLNNDPGFLKWLGEIYDLAGVPRQQLLTPAFDSGDAARVCNFFRGYLAAKIPQRQRTETRLPLENPTAGRRPSVSVADVDGKQKKIWTGQEIRQFFLDKAKGLFDGRAHEANRIEQDIFNAQKEGRIAPNSVQARMPGRRPWE